jgi:hypothetical protein
VGDDEGEVGLGLTGQRCQQISLEVLSGLVEVVDDDALRAAEQ